jgi:hypothetical protein
MAFMMPSIPFHGSQKYLEVHASQVFIVQTIFLIRDDMNISDTKMVTKKTRDYAQMYLYLEFITSGKGSRL